MVDTQRVHNTWLSKADFSTEGWIELLSNFDIDEDIRDRAFTIKVWDADVYYETRERRIIDASLD